MALVLACSAPARAACERSVAALSEARAARWLVGDELRLQSTLDLERERLRHAVQLSGTKQSFHVFASGSGVYQRIFGMETCSNHGPRQGSLDRVRGLLSAGITHDDSGLHVRLSVLHANDHLAVPGIGKKKDAKAATAGYRQNLYALRLGHERWFQTVFGYVDSEQPYTSPGEGGIRIDPRMPTAPAPGYYFGATVPALRTSMVTLLQRGRPEIVSLMASELRPGNLPFSIGLGPTYIREERQVVGLLRLRGFATENVQSMNTELTRMGKRVPLTGVSYQSSGPLLELSVEGRDARLRHGRFRYQYVYSSRSSAKGWNNRAAADLSVYAEGTLFRSRYFSETHEPASAGLPGPRLGPRRGNAWGLGGGVVASAQISWIALSMEAIAGLNRPELLALVPSAHNRAEVQFVGSLRFEY